MALELRMHKQNWTNKSKTRQTMGMKAVVWDRKKEGGEEVCRVSLSSLTL